MIINDYSIDEVQEIPVSFHECSKEEIRELAPPALDARDTIGKDLAEETTTTSLFCIDWRSHASELNLFG